MNTPYSIREVIKLIRRKADVGVILLASNLFSFFLVIEVVNPFINRLLAPAILSGTITQFELNLIVLVPLNVLTIFSLMLYIIGKKEFFTKKNRIMPALSLFSGSLLFVLGLFFSWVEFGLIEYYAHKVAIIGTPFINVFISESPVFFWFVLWAISGIILAIDGWEILSVLDQRQQERVPI